MLSVNTRTEVQVQQFAEQTLKLKFATIEAMNSGLTNRCFLLKSEYSKQYWFAKVNQHYLANSLVKEHKAYQLLGYAEPYFNAKAIANQLDCLLIPFINGRTIRPFDASYLPRIASMLANLHQITSGVAGNIIRPKQRKLNPSKQFTLMIRALTSTQITFDAQLMRLIAKVQQSLATNQSVFEQISQFNLVHGDLHSQNIIAKPSGHLALIDWERAHFGDAAFDYVFIEWFNPNLPINFSFQHQLVAEAKQQGVSIDNNFELRMMLWSLFRLVTDYLYLTKYHHQLISAQVSEQFYYLANLLLVQLN